MKKAVVLTVAMVCFSAVLAQADIVVLRDGKSYSGAYTGEPGGKLTFKDNQGIQYTFPMTDVQTVVFSNLSDNVSLRNGQMYTGQWVGVTRISFRGSNGIAYVFPIRDVSSLVLTHHNAQGGAAVAGAAPAYQQAQQYGAQAAGAMGQGNVPPAPSGMGAPMHYAQTSASPGAVVQSIVIPQGTQISVRTDETIDSTKDALGRQYAAKIQQDVVDSTGAVGIPAGTEAKLQVVDMGQGNANQSNTTSKNLALDLYSVILNGREYRVDSSSVAEKGSAGFGMNKRTAEYAGGGAGFGALMGAIFGGGKGAGIGTLAGGALGAAAQYMTRGKQVTVPAESVLTFQVDQTLVMHP
ncbi:MAG: hypothetical protein ACLGXA_07430 [Acidobacteriota bacterium]